MTVDRVVRGPWIPGLGLPVAAVSEPAASLDDGHPGTGGCGRCGFDCGPPDGGGAAPVVGGFPAEQAQGSRGSLG